MNLEKQVVSLELAKKLKELGVKQESLFWWGQSRENEDYYLEFEGNIASEGYFGESAISAFTVAELGEMLPFEFEINNEKYAWYSGKLGEDFQCTWRNQDNHAKWNQSVAKSEADARAKMLVYLIENNLMSDFLSAALSKPTHL